MIKFYDTKRIDDEDFMGDYKAIFMASHDQFISSIFMMPEGSAIKNI
jgi:hypothetical protein